MKYSDQEIQSIKGIYPEYSDEEFEFFIGKFQIDSDWYLEEFKFIKEKFPDLIFKKIPELDYSKLLTKPSLDQIIVSFLAKECEVYVEPRLVGEWNGWDTLSAMSLIFAGDGKLRNIASTLFFNNRSSQVSDSAEDWRHWKMWALDREEFKQFKLDLLSQIKIYNKKIREDANKNKRNIEKENELIRTKLNDASIMHKVHNALRKYREKLEEDRRVLEEIQKREKEKLIYRQEKFREFAGKNKFKLPLKIFLVSLLFPLLSYVYKESNIVRKYNSDGYLFVYPKGNFRGCNSSSFFKNRNCWNETLKRNHCVRLDIELASVQPYDIVHFKISSAKERLFCKVHTFPNRTKLVKIIRPISIPEKSYFLRFKNSHQLSCFNDDYFPAYTTDSGECKKIMGIYGLKKDQYDRERIIQKKYGDRRDKAQFISLWKPHWTWQ